MDSKSDTWVEYLSRRWFLVVAAVVVMAWVFKLHSVAFASAEELEHQKQITSDIPVIKEKIDRMEKQQAAMAVEQQAQGKILARIEAKL